MAHDEDRSGEQAREGVVKFLSARDRPIGRSILRELEDHWAELRSLAGGLPRRADLNSGRIAPALPHAFIIERAAPGVARLRIAGRVIVGLMGGEARGLPLSLLFTSGARTDLQEWVERCFSTPAIVELALSAPQGALRSAVTGRLLLLPMLDADGQVTRALGGLLLDTSTRRGPLRFEIGDAAARCQPILPAESEPALAAVGGRREAERPWLRLVVSNS
jgi:hypothetical protein